MTLSVLAVLFLAFMLLITYFGYKTISRRVTSLQTQHKEKCFVCGRQLEKTDLIERTVGDHKIVFFCRDCARALADDAGTRRT